MELTAGRKRGGQIGNQSRMRGAKLQDAIWKAVREDNFERLDRMCRSIAERAAEGDLACATFIYDRLAGKPMPMMPDVDSDRSFAITWSFGPSSQVVDSTAERVPSAPLQVEAGTTRED